MNAPPPRSARFALRDATAEAHHAAESGFSALDLRKVEDYRAFLSRLAAAFLPLEATLEAGGITCFLPDWPQRRRRDLLTQHLADRSGRALLAGFGPETDSRVRAATRFPTPEAGPPRLWTSLSAALEQHLPDDATRRRAAAATNLAFACFGRGQQPASSSPRTAVFAHA